MSDVGFREYCGRVARLAARVEILRCGAQSPEIRNPTSEILLWTTCLPPTSVGTNCLRLAFHLASWRAD